MLAYYPHISHITVMRNVSASELGWMQETYVAFELRNVHLTAEEPSRRSPDDIHEYLAEHCTERLS